MSGHFQEAVSVFLGYITLACWLKRSTSTNYNKIIKINRDIDKAIKISNISRRIFLLPHLKTSILEGAKKSYTFPTRKNHSHQRLSSMVFCCTSLHISFYFLLSSSFSTSLPYHSTIHDDEMVIWRIYKIFFERNYESIGRIMAWICTVLYLTSRMPQIWKNYTRRSVEGLSVFMLYSQSLPICLIPHQSSIHWHIKYLMVQYLYNGIFYVIAEHRHRRRRSKRSVSYGSDSIGYHQLPMDNENYSNRRRSGQIDGGNFV
ncbi:unnamed protein product [Rhizophagus irregularis]|nr:unnamed protein product [Rhizophagus irregularis]